MLYLYCGRVFTVYQSQQLSCAWHRNYVLTHQVYASISAIIKSENTCSTHKIRHIKCFPDVLSSGQSSPAQILNFCMKQSSLVFQNFPLSSTMPLIYWSARCNMSILLNFKIPKEKGANSGYWSLKYFIGVRNGLRLPWWLSFPVRS